MVSLEGLEITLALLQENNRIENTNATDFLFTILSLLYYNYNTIRNSILHCFSPKNYVYNALIPFKDSYYFLFQNTFHTSTL